MDARNDIKTWILLLATLLLTACGGGDAPTEGPVASNAAKPPRTSAAVATSTVREMLHDQMDDILSKIENTGYTHFSHSTPNAGSTFDMHPPYAELKNFGASNPAVRYDLFLDCSGLVGYYVLQGIADPLYQKIPRGYSCVRSLAADFVDLAESAGTFGGTEATSVSNACWSRVEHISEALPGDIIAYRHDDVQYETKTCASGQSIRSPKDQKSTGHVMFVHDLPYRSTETKDSSGKYQWIVQVADATNSTHTSDSRLEGESKSTYGTNKYTAWMTGIEGYVQRCTDGSYRRNCSAYGSSRDPAVANIIIDAPKDSAHPNGFYPTGVGVGKLYVNDAMDGYRTRKSQATNMASVSILRPEACN